MLEETAKIIVSKENQDKIRSDEAYGWVFEDLILGTSNDGNWLIDFDDIRNIVAVFSDFEITEFKIVDAEEADVPKDEDWGDEEDEE